MDKIKAVSYEERRLEYFKKQRDSAERRMNYWCRPKQADRVGWMEASERASEAGIQYNFYKDALEALEKQPKWISVEERLPEHGRYLVITRRGDSAKVHTATYNDMGWWMHANFGEITHWMPLPSAEGLDAT